MEMALWIIFWFFASIGLVQCGFWVAESLRRPDLLRHGYHLIPLYDEPEQLEAQLRLTLSRIFRESGGYDKIILVDMGLGEECREICKKLVWGSSGVYICGPDEITDTMLKLDNLPTIQNGANDVE